MVEEPKKVKIIKRYQNRKLYDTENSTYVTLDDIAQMIRQGEEIQVIDNNSKEDLTNLTLTQIIYEAHKKQKKVLPISILKEIIQLPESVTDFIDKHIYAGIQQVSYSKLIEIIQKKIDERIKEAIGKITNFHHLKEEVEKLEKRLNELEEKINNLS